MDGLNCQVVVKSQAIPLVLNLLPCRVEIQDLFHKLNFIVHGVEFDGNRYIDCSPQDLEHTYGKFVDTKYDKDDLLPFPLFNSVKPTQTNRFLIHLLLSMGKFNNEGELFQGNTMAQLFLMQGSFLVQIM